MKALLQSSPPLASRPPRRTQAWAAANCLAASSGSVVGRRRQADGTTLVAQRVLMPRPSCKRGVSLARCMAAPPPASSFLLSYELVKGALVSADADGPPQKVHPPFTAVIIHGILGSRRNLVSFARRLALENPAWQFLLVDLRNHGQSAQAEAPGEHTLTAAALDVLHLLHALKLFPHCLIGHSFGGKVAMCMVSVFGRRLPRPVQVWVLDTVPGDVYADGGDHPRNVIQFVLSLPMPLPSRKALIDTLLQAGFSLSGAQWMTTNLGPAADGSGMLDWVFNIRGISDMYHSYEQTDLWALVEKPPEGTVIDFVRAERSAFRWSIGDEERIRAAGARVHLLHNSGHWVHQDAPAELARIMAPSFVRLKH